MNKLPVALTERTLDVGVPLAKVYLCVFVGDAGKMSQIAFCDLPDSAGLDRMTILTLKCGDGSS